MNLLYVSMDPGVPIPGRKGASIHAVEICRAFRGLGFRVTAIAGAAPREAPAQAEPFANRLIRVETETAFGETRRAAETRRIRANRALAQALAEAWAGATASGPPPDLVYERYSLWSFAAAHFAKTREVPYVIEVNAPLPEEQARYRGLARVASTRRIARTVLRSATVVAAVSTEVREWTLEQGADPARVLVAPNGVDPARFSPAVPAREDICPRGAFVVGFAGSLKPWHGVEVLFDAFLALRRSDAAYHLLVIGDGPLLGWLRERAAASGLAAAVTLAGSVEHDEVPGLLRRADVLAAPYPPLEGFYFSPLKLYEYMAVGGGIVASAIGQLREVVEDGRTGLLVPPGDPEALATAVRHLRASPELRAELGRAARAAVESRHTWRKTAERILESVVAWTETRTSS